MAAIALLVVVTMSGGRLWPRGRGTPPRQEAWRNRPGLKASLRRWRGLDPLRLSSTIGKPARLVCLAWGWRVAGFDSLNYRSDAFCERYQDLLTGVYDCVDRIVLNAYFGFAHNPGGFRIWWRRLHGDSEEHLDNAHLMRMAGRFARRLRASAKANGIPVIDCKQGERKHRIANEYLATHQVGFGLFLILVARAPAPVWEVKQGAGGKVAKLLKKQAYVNHYSFHIRDPQWGHLTIKMSGHPPFPAQIILNGHEYVACQAQADRLGFTKEGNCFTRIANPAALTQIADTLSQPATVGLLMQACERWIYSACLLFGLDLDEQARSGFTYSYSVYQVEYSRNLQFRIGAQMEAIFTRMVDRTRSRLDIPIVRTLFGAKARPHRDRASGPPAQEVVIERPEYGLTWFKLHFGRLQLKAYTKGEHVLRLEATVHNTNELRCGRVLEKFPEITSRLSAILDRFATTLDCVDVGFIDDDQILDRLTQSSQLGKSRIGGIDLNKPRLRNALRAVQALAIAPPGFTVAQLTDKVRSLTRQAYTEYTVRQAAYDLRKLRAKDLISKPGRSRRYVVPPAGARTISALLVLRDDVMIPILAGVRSPRPGPKPSIWTPADRHYEKIRVDMEALFKDLGIAAAA